MYQKGYELRFVVEDMFELTTHEWGGGKHMTFESMPDPFGMKRFRGIEVDTKIRMGMWHE